MPKFVPVVDTEKSAAERANDRSFDKHRHFDNPHKVDRGWQQGNVGWGVLGEFGSSSKDDSAQVVRRAEGANKMVKNERGLWVKAKELDDGFAGSATGTGRGRGGGIPVLGQQSTRTTSSETYRDYEPNNRQFADADDEDRYRSTGNRRRSRSRSRSPDRHRDHRNRRSRERDREGRDDRQDSRRSNRSRSRSRDRSHRDRDYDRKRRGDSRDRRRDDSRDRRSDHRRSTRSPSKERRGDSHRRQREDDREKDPEHVATRTDAEAGESEQASDEAGNDSLPEDFLQSITAVQVINRFHEVFSNAKQSQSERLNDLAQLFAKEATISSLKTGTVYLTGQDAIKESFTKTTAAPCTISKRMYLERAAPTATASSVGSKVTFCLDFHRPGTAPGLGDKAKHSVLLYRCAGVHITHIYGMVDQEQLSAPEDMEKTQVMKSKVWGFVKAIVCKEWEDFDETLEAHFHNYDRMEVWGLV